jgi:hypothetical protein
MECSAFRTRLGEDGVAVFVNTIVQYSVRSRNGGVVNGFITGNFEREAKER